MHTIFEIADHILAKTPYGLSNRELQKLLYLAQGFHLAQTGEALFQEDFQAWKFGPVNPSLFHKYKTYGYISISPPSPDRLIPISATTFAFIAALMISFSAVGQSALIEYSHADIPWAEKYIPDQNIVLPKENIQSYFKEFASFDDYKDIANQKYEFHNLISSRLQYLDDLPKIGDDWISGNAVAPNAKACQLAKEFVSGLERKLFATQARPSYPNIVMGPIPTGGVCLEFTSTNSIYLHFHNNGLMEVEVEKDGYFTDVEVSFNSFEENFSEFYKEVLA